MNFGSKQSQERETLKEIPPPVSVCTMQEILKRTGPINIIELVQTCIEEAYVRTASDIHIEPTEKDVKIRLRIDGMLSDSCTLPLTILPEVISRIKVLTNLRTDEHHLIKTLF